jgi:molybdopterin-guanine dinucleotide biosynthesis protein A
MIQDCTAIILAGGESKRMGRDKANVLLGEQTLLQHVISAMQQTFPYILLSVHEPRPDIDLWQVCDTPNVSGPLAGVLAALEQIKTPWAFIVACDMPYIQPAMVARLAQYRGDYQAVVPVVQGHDQTMAAFYARDILPILHGHLANSGKNSLRAVFNHLNLRYVDETELLHTDPNLCSFFDLDTPQDLLRALNQTY